MNIRYSCRNHCLCPRPTVVNALRSNTPAALHRLQALSPICLSNHRLHHLPRNPARCLSAPTFRHNPHVRIRRKVAPAPPQPLPNLLEGSADSWEREMWLDSGLELSRGFAGEALRPSVTDHLRSYLDTHDPLSSRPALVHPPDACEGPPSLEAFERALESGKSGKLAVRSYKDFKEKEPRIPLTSKALTLLTRDFALLGMSKELLMVWDEEKLKAAEVVELWKFAFEGIEQERKDAALKRFISTCREVGRDRLAALLTQKIDIGLTVSNYSDWDLPLVQNAGTLEELRNVIREIQDSGRQISRPTSEAIFIKLLQLDALDDAITLINDPRLHVSGSKSVSLVLEKIRYGQFEKGHLFVKGLLKSSRYLCLTEENLQAAFRLTLRPMPLLALWKQLPSDALPKRDISPRTLKAFFQRVVELTTEPVHKDNPSMWKAPRKSLKAFREIFTQCMYIMRKQHSWTQKLLAPSFATILHRFIWHWDTGDQDLEQQRRDPQHMVPIPEARMALNSLSKELLEAIVHQVMWHGANTNAAIAKKRLATWDIRVPEETAEMWPFPIFWSWVATLQGTPLWGDPQSEALRAVEKVVYMKGLSIPYLRYLSPERKVLFLLRNRLQKYLEWQGKLQQDRSSVDRLIQKIWEEMQKTDQNLSCYAVAVLATRDLKLGDMLHLMLFKDFCEVLARLGRYDQLMKMLRHAHTYGLVLAPEELQEVVRIITKYDARGMLHAIKHGTGKRRWVAYRAAVEAIVQAQEGTKRFGRAKGDGFVVGQRDTTWKERKQKSRRNEDVPTEEVSSEETPHPAKAADIPLVLGDKVEGERIL